MLSSTLSFCFLVGWKLPINDWSATDDLGAYGDFGNGRHAWCSNKIEEKSY